MRTRNLILATFFFLGAAALIAAQSQSAADRLEEGRKAELSQGLQRAVTIYESILRDFPNDARNGAKALVQIVRMYEFLGDEGKLRENCQRLLTQHGSQPDVTPDVRTRCKEKPRTRPGVFIAQMDPKTADLREPVRSLSDAESYEAGPSFSPDGRSLAFRRYPASVTQAEFDRLTLNAAFVRSLEDKTERAISLCGPTIGGRSFWLSDSKSLFTITTRSGQGSGICFGRSDGQTGHVLQPTVNYISPNLWAAWSVLSPDASMLYGLYVAHPLWIFIAINPATGIPIEGQGYALPFEGVEGGTPSSNTPLLGLSPDGRTVAAIRGAVSPNARLVRFNTDGSDRHYQQLVTGVGRMANVVWSKDGSRIFFAKSEDGNVWQIMQVSATGGTPSFTGLEVTGLRFFDVNRDNTQIAFDGFSYKISAP
jgi:WD40-like Beta Propeller Repeat